MLALYSTTFCQRLAILVFFLTSIATNAFAQPIRVVIAGLNHDHVGGILQEFNNDKIIIVGIAEPDKELWEKYGKRYHLPDSLFSEDLEKLLILKRPDAVLGYNAAAQHLNIVRVAAPLGIPVMVEKPLAATLDQAREMESLAKKYNIKLLTNYETTWYASYHDIYNTIYQDSIGQIRKMIAHDGHQGPKEIGCSEAFLKWLTDPDMNGAGALNDFGCYGADLMTWLMKGARPIAVTAITRNYKPDIYSKVDDDATVMLEYPGATGLIEASWNWPFSIKDLEVYGQTGYLHAFDNINILSRLHEKSGGTKAAKPLEAPIGDAITYLTAVLKKQVSAEQDPSSLDYNMVVMEILDAAKRSAKSGKRICL